MSVAIKPPFTYYGGKTRLAGQIAALLPEHGHYVEPFAGSLAVLLAKTPTKLETVNDIDQELMTFWRVLRDQPEALSRAATLTPHSRAEHLEAFAPTTNDLETARRVWVRLTQGRSSRLTPTGWRHFASPAGTGSSVPEYLEAYAERMPPVATRLAAVSLECRPALDVIASYGQHADALLYCDPPYLASTRNGTNYAHEMGDPAAHLELSEALHAARAAVVLSGYASPLYADIYGDWYRHDIATGTGQGDGYQSRTEVLWSNRPMPAQLELFALAEAVR